MNSRLRVILDTNVLVSAMLSSRSTPGNALRLAAQTCILLASDATIAEAEEVIQRSKFDALVSPAARAEFLVRYREAVTFVMIVSRIEVCRDVRDNKFLDLAIDGRAEVIVTGDEDLLVLDPFQGVRILSPRAYLAFKPDPGSQR
jgi:putative PIN family toxin of toxin-antitoxin system